MIGLGNSIYTVKGYLYNDRIILYSSSNKIINEGRSTSVYEGK